jgi:S-adenosylmethionine synthetase
MKPMSIETIAYAHQAIHQNQDLSRRLEESDGTPEAFAQIAAELGYEVDTTEVSKVLAASAQPNELDEERLDEVVGGAVWGTGSVASKYGAGLKSFGSFDRSGTFRIGGIDGEARIGGIDGEA